MFESRYDRLMGMYFKAVYLELDEAARVNPAESILEACRLSKQAISDEVKKCGYQDWLSHSHPKD